MTATTAAVAAAAAVAAGAALIQLLFLIEANQSFQLNNGLGRINWLFIILKNNNHSIHQPPALVDDFTRISH